MMSVIERAPRNASTKRSEALFSDMNSKVFTTSRVHERVEASRRPIMIDLTIGVASMNICTGVS